MNGSISRVPRFGLLLLLSQCYNYVILAKKPPETKGNGLMSTNGTKELKQKYLNERRDFHLEPNRIRLFAKDLDGETETFIQYELLTTTTRTLTQQDGRVYIAAISFGIFSLIGFALNLAGEPTLMRWAPLWFIASLIFFGFHFYKRRRYLLVNLSDRTSIFFLADKPSKEELNNFLQFMFNERKRYLREKHLSINPTNDPNTEMEKFNWLLKEDIISDVEFQEMKRLLLTAYRKSESSEANLKGFVS